MKNSKYLPVAYKEFMNTKDLRKHKENKKQLTRYVFRYRLAKAFNGLKADCIGKTLDGYNAVMKVFLAYTAYEQLHRGAVGLHIFDLRRVEEQQIIDSTIASKLRENELLIDFLVEHTSDSTLLGKLIGFRNRKSDDIICVAYALRNVFAHGELTATAVGTTLKRQRNTLNELADELLTFTNSQFTKCVEKLR